jgi:hypothetical protein
MKFGTLTPQENIEYEALNLESSQEGGVPVTSTIRFGVTFLPIVVMLVAAL